MGATRLAKPVGITSAVLLVLSAAASAQAPSAPSPLPDGPSRTWKRIATADHAVVGDADERYLRDALEDLESVLVMVRRWIPNAVPPGRKVTAVVFRDASDKTFFYRMDGEGKPLSWTLSYYHSGRENDHIVFAVDPIERRERLSGPFNAYGRTLVYSNASPNLPAWVWQGLAQFASALPIDHLNRDRVVGRPLPSVSKHLQGATLFPLADLIDPIRGPQLGQKNPQLYWAQTWAFMHYLLLGRDGRSSGQLMGYIEAIRQGRPASEAFLKAFGANAADLQTHLERYVRDGQYRTEPLAVPSAASTPATPMLESEVEALHGELFMGRSNPTQAEPVLTRALARNPQSRVALMTLAALRTDQRRFDEAAALLGPVVAATPDDYDATMLLGTALRLAKQYEKAYEVYLRATKLNPMPAAAWFDLSVTAAALNREPEAKAAMDATQRLRPGAYGFFIRGVEMAVLGRDADVLRDMDACVSAPDCGPQSVSYAAFIGALSARRLGQPARAEEYLAAAARTAAPDFWRSAVHAFLTGQATPDEFLNKARHNGEQTEAHFYVGMMLAIAGRREEALRHLQWIRERGAQQYVEYRMGLAELERLEGTNAPAR
jgi:tetratricopeptide (TPR) repeat protein